MFFPLQIGNSDSPSNKTALHSSLKHSVETSFMLSQMNFLQSSSLLFFFSSNHLSVCVIKNDNNKTLSLGFWVSK